MGDIPRRAVEPAFDPRTTPVPRRRVLVLMGLSTLAASGGLGTILAGCAGPPVPVLLDVDPASLVPGTPVEVPFTVTLGNTLVPGSVWLLKNGLTDELIAYDPRCTHGLCQYAWQPALTQFVCRCHDGQFALDGTVVSGKPPKPLNRFPVSVVEGEVEVQVPGDFDTPRASLPA